MAYFWKAQDLGFHLVPISRGLGHAHKAIFEAGSTKIGTRTLASNFSMHLGDLEYSLVGLLESSNSELSIEPKKSSCQSVCGLQRALDVQFWCQNFAKIRDNSTKKCQKWGEIDIKIDC